MTHPRPRVFVLNKYKAFPELDRLTKLQRAQLVRIAADRSGWRDFVRVVRESVWHLLAMSLVARGALWAPRWAPEHVVLVIGSALLVEIIIMMRIGDICTHVQIRSLLARTACTACGETLQGTVPAGRGATCASCGQHHPFDEKRLRKSDLVPPMHLPTLRERCEGCGYSMKGLPIERAVVRCPECGAEALAYGEKTPPP